MPAKSNLTPIPKLADRQRELLAAVVQEYIATAEPVASGQLVRRYHLDVSSATVRNELAALEELGLLTHPHTSAGRVPTDLGYRYFIESLMPRPALRPEEQLTVSHQFRQAIVFIVREAEFDRNVPAFDIADFAQPLAECRQA